MQAGNYQQQGTQFHGWLGVALTPEQKVVLALVLAHVPVWLYILMGMR